MTDKKKERRSHFWEFDPSFFQPGPKSGFLQRHLLYPSRSVLRYTLYGLAVAYPVLLVIIGATFGGLVFWSSLAGSMAAIFLIIKKAGYANNFEGWNIGHKRIIGVFIGYGLVLAVFTGLLYTPFKFMTLPLVLGIVVLIVLIGTWRKSRGQRQTR